MLLYHPALFRPLLLAFFLYLLVPSIHVQAQGDVVFHATPSTTPITPDNAGQVVLLGEWQSPGVDELEYSPDGRYLAFAMSTGVSLRDTITLEEARFFETSMWSHSIAFSPDGQTLAGGFMDGSTWLWRVDDGTLIDSYYGHADIVTGLAFSPDGLLLASSSNDGSVQIRRVTDGTIVNTLNEIPDIAEYDYISDVEFSADGSLLAASVLFGKGVEERRVVMVWQVSDGTHLKSLESQTSSEVEYFDLAFSSAGGSLIAAGHWQTEGWTVPGLDALFNYSDSLIWDYFQRDELERLGVSGQEAEAADFAWSVDYSSDGQLLAIGAKGRIKLLRADGFPLAILKTQAGTGNTFVSPSQSESLASKEAVNSVAFSPSGQTLAASSSDGTVQVWGISSGDPPFIPEPKPLEDAPTEPATGASAPVGATLPVPTLTLVAESPEEILAEAETANQAGNTNREVGQEPLVASTGPARARTILLGVMAVSGVVFIVGLAALFWQSQKKD